MALQKCSECGTQISTTAAACPKCGARIEVALAPKKGSARRGRIWLAVIVGIFAFGVYNSFNRSPPPPPPALPEPASPARLKADYLKKVSDMNLAMHEMKVGAVGGSTDAMVLVVETFNAGAQIVQDASGVSLDKGEADTVRQLAEALAQRQRQAFPVMRQKYGPIAARALWKSDIEVSTTGARYTTAAFVAGAFAAHRNIADAQEAIHPLLMRLRFKRSEYRWIPSEEQYTYYAVDSPADDALAVVDKTGTITLKVNPPKTT